MVSSVWCQRRGVRGGGRSVTVSVRKWLVVSSGGGTAGGSGEIAEAIALMSDVDFQTMPIVLRDIGFNNACCEVPDIDFKMTRGKSRLFIQFPRG
jgi:hypothetical protein